MAKHAGRSSAGSELRAEASTLLSAYVRFAGWRAAGAALLIALGSVFDGLGLLFLVPVLDLVVATRPSRAGRLAGAVEGLLGGYPATERLLILLLAFAGLMLVRGVVLRQRDRVTETLQLGFVEDV